MKTGRILQKYGRSLTARDKYEQALEELELEIKSVFGEKYWVSEVTGDGVVVKSEDDDLLVAPLGSILGAIKENTFTSVEDYSL